MNVSFVTPAAAAVGLLGLVAVAALVVSEERGRRLARSLGLAPAGAGKGLQVATALVLLAAVVALAAAQPVIARERPLQARADAEVLVVLDISRSMEARTSPDAETRFVRAQEAAVELRSQLGGIPVGVASLTDRLLPHLFPTPGENAFAGTVRRAVAVNTPPPESFLGVSGRATSLGALGDLGTQNYFGQHAERRVAVVFTDGESAPVDSTLAAGLDEGDVRVVFVHVWAPNERVFDEEGSLERGYFPDPNARAALDAVAAPIDATVLAESETEALAAEVQRLVGSGPSVRRGSELRTVALAPFVAALGVFPLGFVLWRRNR